MNISSAQLECQIRRYLWAKSKAAEEIREQFPHFWLFKGGTSWKFYQFVKRLDLRDQEIFVSGLLKGWHRNAAAALGETLSIDEKHLDEQFAKFHRLPSTIDREIAVRKRMGSRTTFANKRKVQNLMIANFKNAFAYHGLDVALVKGYSTPLLRMEFSGWTVQTNFNFSGGRFGGGRSRISYDHLIASEERICHPTTPGVTAPAMVLDCLICWIGLGRMEWDYLTDSDIEPACHSVVTLCREFFDELPKLLRGLEREKITAVVATGPLNCAEPA